MSGRTALKTYFLTGATPTEANFSDLIDSVLVLSEDITSSLVTTSEVKALSATAGKTLNDSIISIDSRVTTLENADNAFASNYYTKTEVDSNISGVNSQFNTLPYAGQISAIDTRVTDLESAGSGYANTVHSHGISDVNGLQDALDLKATIAFVRDIESSIISTINGLEVGDESAEVASLQSQVNTINTTISGLPTSSQVNAKADIGHTHLVANISDINSEYYNRTQTDALLSSVKSTPAAHTHTESEITDLDKYTQGAVDLKITDHSALLNNPHSVTKAQVGLADVENLSVVDLFQTPQAQALATDADLSLLEQAVSIHTANINNPHGVTKAQVSLGNVPNINFQSLLDAHIADSNPHNINLSYFDVYSRAETDARVQLYVDTLRYAFKPTAPTDGAGAVGDLAYHDTGMYFKFGPTDWRHILASKTFNDGSPGSSYEIETPKFNVTTPGGVDLFSVDNTTNTTNINTTLVSIGGATNISNILNVTGDVSLGNSLNVSNLFQVDKTTNTTNISTANVSIGGATNIDNTLNVTGAVSLGGSTFNVAGNTTNISSTHVSLGGSTFNVTGNTTNIASTHVSLGGDTLNVNGQVSLASGMTTRGAVSISNTLNVSAHSILSSLRATTAVVDSLDSGSGAIKTTGTLEGGSTTVTSLNAGSGSIQTTGTLTTGGATVTSLNAGSGAISTTGTLSTGGATVTSLDAGSGLIKTTGNIQGTDLTLSGNLTVNGTTTSIDTTNLNIEDNFILINKNQTGTPAASLTSGIAVERGSANNAEIYWDETSDRWKVNTGGSVKTLAFVEDAYSQ